jgi:hypothetical protein
MLQVVMIYQTSKGYFRTLAEAEKKYNRPKNNSGEYPDMREDIKVKHALFDGASYFFLEHIEVK